MGVVGPRVDVGRPPGVGVVLVVADDLRIVAEPGLPDQHRHPARRAYERLDGKPLRLDAPLLPELAREREDGIPAGPPRPPRPGRPAPRPRGDPRCAPPR